MYNHSTTLIQIGEGRQPPESGTEKSANFFYQVAGATTPRTLTSQATDSLPS